MANRQYKDTLFRDLFGSEERKGYALELYNALNGTEYGDPEELTLNTIDGALFLGMRNDVSFLVGEDMVLFEHQSTVNRNMPLRGLLYFAALYSKEVERRGINLFVRRLIRLPKPQYVIFYNGVEERPDREVLRLSDAFGGGGDLEMTATVINVNEGRNPDLFAASKTLAGYSHFVVRVREYNGLCDLRTAVELAIDSCVADGHLVDYLRERRAEVTSLLLTQWDEERDMEILREDAALLGWEEGHAKGLADGREEGLVKGRAEGLAKGRKEGRKEGRAEGHAEGAAEAAELIATKLRELGVDEAVIDQARSAVPASE